LAGLSQWGTNFLVAMTFPILLGTIGLGGAYSLYAIFAAISGICAWKFIRETKGRSLEQMELWANRNQSASRTFDSRRLS